MYDNTQLYKDLREKHREFAFDGYEYNDNENTLDVVYHFSIGGLARFSPEWKFTKIKDKQVNTDKQRLETLVFSLGMVELVSYWKICCPPYVCIGSGNLNDEQIIWWKKLYRKGLGEFFFINGITPDDNFMDIICEPVKPSATKKELNANTNTTTTGKQPKILVPIGGGKDSAVTLELLRGVADRYCYIINPRNATDETFANSGIESKNLITAVRSLDKNMLSLNKQGYLNGHTPFSAVVAFSSVLAGYINGMDYVALSNESSANENTVENSEINHQYSKSYEFERDFIQYESKFIGSNVKYFSLLRPLSELQIAKIFANYKQYHPVFKSCNAASKKDGWCGVCPKCLFVYIILSPFLVESKLISIFNKNLFEDLSLTETLDKLVGFMPEKPFECIGRRDEVKAALELTIDKYGKLNKPLPPLLFNYYTNKKRKANDINPDDILKAFDTENNVPPQFLSIVSEAAKGCVN